MNEQETSVSNLLERDGIISTKVNDVEVEKPYKLRKLNAKDISPMIKILKGVNLKRLKSAFENIDFMGILNTQNSEDNTADEQEAVNKDKLLSIGTQAVFEIIPMLLDSLDNCLSDVNKLLANVANMEVTELENLDLDIYFNLIYDFINKEEFMGFFKVASKFIKLEI